MIWYGLQTESHLKNPPPAESHKQSQLSRWCQHLLIGVFVSDYIWEEDLSLFHRGNHSWRLGDVWSREAYRPTRLPWTPSAQTAEVSHHLGRRPELTGPGTGPGTVALTVGCRSSYGEYSDKYFKGHLEYFLWLFTAISLRWRSSRSAQSRAAAIDYF